MVIETGFATQAEKTKLIYRPEFVAGAQLQLWSGAKAVAHANPATIFSGSTGGLGLPITHPNGLPNILSLVYPLSSGVFDFKSVDYDPATATTDQWLLAFVIFAKTNGSRLRDVNTDTGERFKVFVAGGGEFPTVRFENSVDTTAAPNVLATLKKGWNVVLVQCSDLNQGSGLKLEKDDGGNGVYTPVTDPVAATWPTYKQVEVDADYVLAFAEFDNPADITPLPLPLPPASTSAITDSYVINHTGVPSTGVINLWATFNNTYGPSYYLWNVTVGSAALPTLTQNNVGIAVPKNGFLKQAFSKVKSNITNASQVFEMSVDIIRGTTILNVGKVSFTGVTTNTSKDLILNANYAVNAGDIVMLSYRYTAGASITPSISASVTFT